jgi:hypothetical protein
MSAATIVIIIVVVAVVVLVGVVLITARRRLLKRRFGLEYDRVVGEKRSHRRAAVELARRRRRVQRLGIRPLTATARAKYAGQWPGIQQRFVDNPERAVIEAELLMLSVMKERGYPAEDHDQVAADLSVTNTQTLDHYRAARRISADAESGGASTEHLRQAFLHFRWVFGDLLGRPADAAPGATDGAKPGPAEVVQPRAAIADPAAPDERAQRPLPDGDGGQTNGAGRGTDGAEGEAPVPQLWRVPQPRSSEEQETAR